MRLVQEPRWKAGGLRVACKWAVERPQDGAKLVRQSYVGSIVGALSLQSECDFHDSREIVRQGMLDNGKNLQRFPRQPRLAQRDRATGYEARERAGHDDEQAGVYDHGHDYRGARASSSRRASAAAATASTGGRPTAISLSLARAASGKG